MSTTVSWNERAILQNARGEHLYAIDPADVPDFELLAENGRVERIIKTKRAKRITIFRLLPEPEMGADPSNSRNSACSLTRTDMDGLAGMNFAESRVSVFQLERWVGHGLITA